MVWLPPMLRLIRCSPAGVTPDDDDDDDAGADDDDDDDEFGRREKSCGPG